LAEAFDGLNSSPENSKAKDTHRTLRRLFDAAIRSTPKTAFTVVRACGAVNVFPAAIQLLVGTVGFPERDLTTYQPVGMFSGDREKSICHDHRAA